MDKIFSFILNPQFGGLLLFIKIVFLVVSIVMLAVIGILLQKTNWMKFRYLEEFEEFLAFKSREERKLLLQWKRISKRLKTGREQDYKLSVIEADGMLENVLKGMGYPGRTVEEQAKGMSAAIFSNRDRVLEAHKIRDKAVHNPDYNLSLDEAKRVMDIYEDALKELDMM